MKPRTLAALATSVAITSIATHAGVYEDRERDWRNGAIVYQVLVDRFAPPADLEAKRALYPAPKRLLAWAETPKAGAYLPDQKLSAHELDFWGGDLASTTARLDHVQRLGADALYLNPIHLAYTNHKYDALDFQAVSPEYGTRDDFRRLAADAKRRGLKVVLDGVFNHMGRNAPIFREAFAAHEREREGHRAAPSPERAPPGGARAAGGGSTYRDWFAIGPQYEGGARVWSGFQNHPELNLENAAVRRYLYEGKDSVVRSWLRDGADGWRLDTAYEFGYRILREMTDAAHKEKPGSLVVGEIVNYPDRWLRATDAVMNFTLRMIVLGFASGEIAPATAARMAERLVRDGGIEPMLKSWVVIDNHDIPRIATQLPDPARRRLVQALQFTLPGAPNIYYGAELGMTGGADPENRGPMRWDLVRDDNPELQWMRQLIALRKAHRALRIGDFRLAESQRLLAFERHTDKALETLLVVANPGDTPVRETLLVANASLMDDTPLVDLLGANGGKPVTGFGAGVVNVEVPPRTVMVLKPVPKALGGYNRYKRVP
ncbi:MAG TPA: alpha-amylase family glycosyl hydrolase [Burkholderiaceae bacterium]|nr:alpha-amylase family glycosyl hydrolase [Burkholderiaceae bacterium]